jgi:hypothetical protein
VSLIPDSYVVLQTPEREIAAFLEVDRGTEDLDTLKRKYKAYVEYRRSGAEQKRYGKDIIRVVTLTTLGKRRLDNLKKAAEAVGAKGRFYFALASDVTSSTVFSAPIWYVGGKPECEPFLKPLGSLSE